MVKITNSNFDEVVLDSEQPVLIKMTAPNCAPCRVLNPLLVKMKKAYPHILFCECDISKNMPLATDLEIRSVPTTMIFYQGELVGRVQGIYKEVVIRAVLGKFDHLKGKV